MSVCAVMLVKDEADILTHTLIRLRRQADHVIVADNGSTDGSREIAEMMTDVTLIDDPEVGYWQSKKTTALAMEAFERGYSWVIPCDADEIWYAPDGRPIRDYLDGLAPDVQIVTAEMFHHIPTSEDSIHEKNPIRKIRWRKRERGDGLKVCCRTRPDLVIEMGNHAARTSGTSLTVSGLVIRHFSWRSPEQYVKKIRNGIVAYAHTDFPETTGEHWRQWHLKPDVYGRESLEDIADLSKPLPGDEAVEGHFREWFWSERPRQDSSLILDPCP